MKSFLLHSLDVVYSRLLKLIELIIILFSASLIIVVFSGVICRYFLNASLAWSEELSRFLFVWIMLLAAVLVNEVFTVTNYQLR